MKDNLTLEIEKIFDAPIQKVWEAWTNGKIIRQWSCPPPGKITEGTSDLRLGGEITIVMEFPDGSKYPLYGVYKVIEPPHTLSFTHQWIETGGSKSPETVVTVKLEVINEKQTKMLFTQKGLPNNESLEGHRGGWEPSFENLKKVLEEK